MAEEWKKIENADFDNNPIIRFEEENQELIGKILDIRQGNFGNNVYDIETKDGKITFFGTTVLDRKLKGKEIGTEIKLIYLGEEKAPKSGRMFKNFEVFTK